ncbi:MAG: nucleoside deaminase [Spirochaetes bacterium]|nr:nucleoside deaminase [Spirochaetota bacterium]
MKNPEYYMQIAYEHAEKAGIMGEIPVGALIVFEDKIITVTHNLNRLKHDSTCHAEMVAIRQASQILKNERLNNCELYVTKEPCMMCLGAIIHSRLSKVYFGASDKKYGVCGGSIDILNNFNFNHKPEIISGILKEKCSDQLSSFFRKLRSEKKIIGFLSDNSDSFI